MLDGVMDVACVAHVTPGLGKMTPCEGTVHSIFARAANIILHKGTQRRLATLLAVGTPSVPDGIHVPAVLLTSLREGMPAVLEADTIRLGNIMAPLVQANCGALMIRPCAGSLRREEFLAIEGWRGNGLERLPQSVHDAARDALYTGKIQRWIGLGPGLTPSFDDVCIGAMAMCAGAGLTTPFGRMDSAATTEVSARYLNLAWEGYYGQSVCDVVTALFDPRKNLRRSVRALACHGETSGRDILYGIYLILVWMQQDPGQ